MYVCKARLCAQEDPNPFYLLLLFPAMEHSQQPEEAFRRFLAPGAGPECVEQEL